ncbi:hypothetical protein PR048_024568 [Dryococelus australis]|uniref:DUF4372 domain-containing protein n=1 Tax=Dryococelus australis TaxID=614101 RepID=A0ABQ9GP10_9NEOP|nr:hypothetical protein PR048_024568 [Dryococelus australis]
MQYTTLSRKTQNGFIEVCGNKVLKAIFAEMKNAKYYCILVAHFKIPERFPSYVDFCKKTGKDITGEIIKELEKLGIPLNDFRGQGYDNELNMAGIYKCLSAVFQLCCTQPKSVRG